MKEKNKKYNWVLIAGKTELENNSFLADKSVKTVNAGGKKLCIARIGDKYFAVDDKCPHAGASLGQGRCDASGFVICPHHRYRFSLYNGRGHGYYVETYPVEEKEDGIYVGLPPGNSFWRFFGF